jgi:succinate dehydrogenase / fumarate reductase flavoprotein subunit
MSGYPESMQGSLRLVEKTRPGRVGKALPEMTADEKDKVLQDWHPDFKSDQKRALKIGPSKGMLVPHEVADNLEAHTIIKPEDIDFSNIDYDVDVLIIGAGGAGLSAALLAQENGVPPKKILMVQKLRLGDANSKMSQGGIQATVAPDDNPAIHYLDVIGGGHYENKPELAELLVREGPNVIRWHEELGVMYDKLEDGTMQLAPGGARLPEPSSTTWTTTSTSSARPRSRSSPPAVSVVSTSRDSRQPTITAPPTTELSWPITSERISGTSTPHSSTRRERPSPSR